MLQSDWLVQISLGTSDTVFLWITTAEPQLTGHVFINPVDKNAFMALLWWVTTYMVYRCTVKHYVINNLVTISSMETDKLPGLTFSPTSKSQLCLFLPFTHVPVINASNVVPGHTLLFHFCLFPSCITNAAVCINV